MAAAAFLANLVFACQDGYQFSINCTVSDVNAAYYIFPDGQNYLNLPSGHGAVYLVDLQLSAAGTDTRTANVYANGKITPIVVQNASNLASNLARQFRSVPAGFVPGANIRLAQIT